jgi:hypothetical protein
VLRRLRIGDRRGVHIGGDGVGEQLPYRGDGEVVPAGALPGQAREWQRDTRTDVGHRSKQCVVEHRRPEDRGGGEQRACRSGRLADVAAGRVRRRLRDTGVPAGQQRRVGPVRAASFATEQGRDRHRVAGSSSGRCWYGCPLAPGEQLRDADRFGAARAGAVRIAGRFHWVAPS